MKHYYNSQRYNPKIKATIQEHSYYSYVLRFFCEKYSIQTVNTPRRFQPPRIEPKDILKNYHKASQVAFKILSKST